MVGGRQERGLWDPCPAAVGPVPRFPYRQVRVMVIVSTSRGCGEGQVKFMKSLNGVGVCESPMAWKTGPLPLKGQGQRPRHRSCPPLSAGGTSPGTVDTGD